jgi:hypothetical protein
LILIPALLAVLAPTGCRSIEPAPGPLPIPAVAVEAIHFSGSPLSGPLGEPVPAADPDDALQAVVTWIALESVPAGALKPLIDSARLITSTHGDSPIQPSARLSPGGRLGRIDDAELYLARLAAGDFGRSTPVARLRGALPPGVTAAFSAFDRTPRSHPEHESPLERRAEIQIHRARPDGTGASGASEVQVVLLLEDIAVIDEERDDDDDGGEQPARERRHVYLSEKVLLDSFASNGLHHLVLILPSPFQESPAGALAVVISITPAPRTDKYEKVRHAAAVARCLDDLWLSALRVRSASRPASPAELEWSSLVSALKRVAVPESQRTVLVHLAGAVESPLAEDLVMTAPHPLVGVLAEGVLEEIGSGPVRDRAALAWILERGAYELLAGMLENSQATPELEALLVRHAGEAGRHAPTLRGALAAAGGLDGLTRSLLEENIICLEDPSPASRTRAFDWLAARGRAPAGYDPLAPSRERRAALERTAAEQATRDVEGDSR